MLHLLHAGFLAWHSNNFYQSKLKIFRSQHKFLVVDSNLPEFHRSEQTEYEILFPKMGVLGKF